MTHVCDSAVSILTTALLESSWVKVENSAGVLNVLATAGANVTLPLHPVPVHACKQPHVFSMLPG